MMHVKLHLLVMTKTVTEMVEKDYGERPIPCVPLMPRMPRMPREVKTLELTAGLTNSLTVLAPT